MFILTLFLQAEKSTIKSVIKNSSILVKKYDYFVEINLTSLLKIQPFC